MLATGDMQQDNGGLKEYDIPNKFRFGILDWAIWFNPYSLVLHLTIKTLMDKIGL